MTAYFYMKSGNIITLEHVKNLKTKLAGNGQITEYQVKWEKTKIPIKLFTVSLTEVEAILVLE